MYRGELRLFWLMELSGKGELAPFQGRWTELG